MFVLHLCYQLEHYLLLCYQLSMESCYLDNFWGEIRMASDLAIVAVPDPQVPVPVPLARAPSRPVATGFRCVWVTDSQQMIINLNTMQVKFHTVDDMGLFIKEGEADAESGPPGPVVMVESPVSWTASGSPQFTNQASTQQSAYKVFSLHKMQRLDNSSFYWDIHEKKAIVNTFSFDEKTYGAVADKVPAASSEVAAIQFVVWHFDMPPLPSPSNNSSAAATPKRF